MKKYHLGLDIGTSSIGWAATDDQFRLLRIKGKNAIGVRLFNEGKTAADRRSFRVARRRLARRRWRLRYLEDFFESHLAEVDPTFLARLKQSDISPKDDQKKPEMIGRLLFPEQSSFGYPTLLKLREKQIGNADHQLPAFNIYALRQAMMEKDQQFDLREVYLAIHHIVKYRGHFLNPAPVSRFKVGKIDFVTSFTRINDDLAQLTAESPFQVASNQMETIGALLLDTDQRKLDRQKHVAEMLTINKADKKPATALAKLLLGYKAHLADLVGVPEQEAKWDLDLSAADSDDKLDELRNEMDDIQASIVDELADLYSQITLNEIIPNGLGLSASMMERYYTHQRQLKELKAYLQGCDSEVRVQFEGLYQQYIGRVPRKKNFAFKKEIEKLLDDSPAAKKIEAELKVGDYLPKQRTNLNGVIPHQLQEQELIQIIEKQTKYYPWLAELNPDEKTKKSVKYKLEQLLAFRIPYYVGPLITANDQALSSGAKFAWAVRKQEGTITPWNFNQKVDTAASANEFIKRMTTKDTYLLGEDVVPAASLFYQRFTVLNELNNVRVNGHRLDVGLKQKLFDEVFKRRKRVTKKYLAKEIEVLTAAPKLPQIEGLADPKQFNSSLGTYIDLKKIVGDKVDQPQYQAQLEQIIEWRTIFEDGQIFAEKLQQVPWLTEKQRRELAAKRYRGWGRLSKKLLCDLRGQDQSDIRGGRSIMDLLWETQLNFMQIVNQPVFQEQITEHNQDYLGNDRHDLKEMVGDALADAYTSPQNKKAIWQVVRLVKDIERAAGNAPASISLEFARSDDWENKGRLTIRRKKAIENAFKGSAAELVKKTDLGKELAAVNDMTDRLYLYFTQGGKDMYDGQPLNIDKLSTDYDIDHILPQSFLKDDSLDNKVLVKRGLNSQKADRLPAKLFGPKMRGYWEELQKSGLISREKLAHLIMTDSPESLKYQTTRFVRRQLVETRQVIKLTASIFQKIYGSEQTVIIETRASLTKQLRETYDLPKVRAVNDYHHAVDAYLTGFAGNYLYRRYPKLRGFFVYGDYQRLDRKDGLKLKSFNMFHDLDLRAKNGGVVADPETGEVIVEHRWLASYLRKIQHFKLMLVTKEVQEKRGELFGATIIPANDTAKLNSRAPISNGKPVELYGSYTKIKVAYMAIIKLVEKNPKYKVVGIPILSLPRLSHAKEKGTEVFNRELHNVIADDPNVKKEFDVVVPKVLYNQLILDGDVKFTLGSAGLQHPITQLVLSDRSLEVLEDNYKLINNESEEVVEQQLVSLFDEIVTQMNRYFPLFDQRSNREKVVQIRDQYLKMPIRSKYEGNRKAEVGKTEIIDNLLTGLHANATQGDLKKSVGIPTFGFFQTSTGINLSENAQLIYQSPSGLFERRVKLKDL